MKTIDGFRNAYRARTTWIAALLLVCLAAWAGMGYAQTLNARSFDHLKTGFALSGAHLQTKCEACHKNGIFKGTPRDCASCHVSGMRFARGNVVKPQRHLPSQLGCEACHNTQTYLGAHFNHSGVTAGSCTNCHSGNLASSKPASHLPTTASCDSCHRTSAWTPALAMDHSSFTAATNCAQCHGVSASGKSATHIPTTLNCSACHNMSPQRWTPTKWDHSQTPVANACSSCHSGAYPPADGRPGSHIPYQTVAVAAAANCDACHKGSYTSWANGRFHSYYSVSTGCANCHNGAYLNAVGKPNTATHAGVTGNCESCHTSTASWASASINHSSFTAATNCAQCHGVSATGKSATHMPTTANCILCHAVAPTPWAPSKWNHTQLTVVNACASCHTGGYPPADGKPANHIPYQSVAVSAAANCDACHKGSYTSWANGKFHSYYSVSTGCFSCHTGAYLNAVGKPSTTTHATVTGSCESCHKSTTSWLTVSYTHTAANAVGTGTCDNCHNGVIAKGKDATHIPIPAGTAKCDACHRSQVSFLTSVTMNHTSVATAQCRSCHNGSYTTKGTQGALAKPAAHIPESQLLNGTAMDCKACHTSTTAWTTMTMNHNNSLGNGSGWCKACHQSGTSYLGSMEKKSLTHQRSTGVTDCSQSGCHRPLGTQGTAYRSW